MDFYPFLLGTTIHSLLNKTHQHLHRNLIDFDSISL